jgi:hypothetical protein
MSLPYSVEEINNIINDISERAPRYSIDQKNLHKFGSKEYDQWCLNYVNGEGGYYVKFLAELVKTLNLKHIVELGNREGLSTLGIYDALPQDGNFITIDIDKDQRYCPDQMFKDKRVQFLFGDVCTSDIVNQIPLDIELLFTDTIHYNFQVQDEFDVYKHLLADVALVGIDDIFVNDKHVFWDTLEYKKWDLTKICHVSGWGLFLYVRKDKLTPEIRRQKAAEAIALIWQRKYKEQSILLEKTLPFKLKTFKNYIRSSVHNMSTLHKFIIKVKKTLGLIK